MPLAVAWTGARKLVDFERGGGFQPPAGKTYSGTTLVIFRKEVWRFLRNLIVLLQLLITCLRANRYLEERLGVSHLFFLQ